MHRWLAIGFFLLGLIKFIQEEKDDDDDDDDK